MKATDSHGKYDQPRREKKKNRIISVFSSFRGETKHHTLETKVWVSGKSHVFQRNLINSLSEFLFQRSAAVLTAGTPAPVRLLPRPPRLCLQCELSSSTACCSTAGRATHLSTLPLPLVVKLEESPAAQRILCILL